MYLQSLERLVKRERERKHEEVIRETELLSLSLLDGFLVKILETSAFFSSSHHDDDYSTNGCSSTEGVVYVHRTVEGNRLDTPELFIRAAQLSTELFPDQLHIDSQTDRYAHTWKY